MRGGKREGAGRPSTGRKQRKYFLTDEEHEQVKQFIVKIRSDKNESKPNV
jgi:hypothetical protein